MHGNQGIIEGRTSPTIFGLAGTQLTREEKSFFSDVQPFGFILFARNCESPDQVSRLVASLRELVGRERLAVLIDQEGGRVVRLKPPLWPEFPPAGVFATLAGHSLEKAKQAVYLNARLIAAELYALGITVNCAPLADIPVKGAHDVIGDRAFGQKPSQVVALARAMASGLVDGGVVPVLKHIPGHGRAMADSHEELPVVDVSLDVLEETDFEPFCKLADLPMGMTAHVLYTALDRQHMATVSPTIIRYIREKIGFSGLLMSDDVSMKAMQGDFSQRTRDILKAGCDIALHCNGEMKEMKKVADGAGTLTGLPLMRANTAMQVAMVPKPVDVASTRSELDMILAA